MKELLPHSFRQSIKRKIFAVRDMHTRLQNLRKAGFACTGAIDGGAYRGDWTREFWNVFPYVPVLMVEPQPGSQTQLLALAESTKGSGVVTAALSEQPGIVSFVMQETNSGIRIGDASEANSIKVPCTTLASILQDKQSFLPNLLKLDLQGHELQAMRGAGSFLARFEVIICELSIIPIGNVPAFAEVNSFFEQHGFCLYDVIPISDRPLDGALWQVDAFYVSVGSKLIASNDWI